MFDSAIRLPKDYFKKDRKQYNNWEQALFRELIQNSVDAKAKNIHVSIETNDLYHIVSFEDDGKGMNKDTIKNALLTMGGTEKEEDNIGGFGQAKIIIYFGHEKYEIKSKNNHVVGSGGEYSIKENDEYFNGTKSTIYIDKNDTSNFTLENELFNVVRKSNFKKTKVFFENAEVLQNSLNYQHKRYFDVGNISFNYTKDNYSNVSVRIGGVHMFDTAYCFEENMDVIFDVKGKSTDLFTANRDSLKNEYNKKLLQIINEMSSKKSSINKSKQVDIIFNEVNDSSLMQDEESIKEKINNIKNNIIKSNSNNSEKNILNEVKEFNYFEKEATKTISKLEKTLEKIKEKKYEKYYPNNFSVSFENHSKNKTDKLLQAKYIKLAHFWEKLIMSFFEYNVLSYTTLKQNTPMFMSKRIFTGFYFSDDSIEGCNISDEKTSKIKIEPTKCINFSLEKIMDVATHELAHLYEKRHNNDFILIELDIRRKAREKFPKGHLNKIYKEAVQEYQNK